MSQQKYNKLLLSGSHNSKVTRHKNIRGINQLNKLENRRWELTVLIFNCGKNCCHASFKKNTYKLWLSFNSFIRILPWTPAILLSYLFWTSFYFLSIFKFFILFDWSHWVRIFYETTLKFHALTILRQSKGQLISKANCQACEFFQKTNEWIRFY